MPWNIPGSSGPDKGGRRPRGSGNGLDALLEPLRGLFGGGDNHVGRWIAIAAALWLAFSSFVLVAEQQRGVVLRFGQMSRVLQPGPHFKLPWPVERVFKVDATSIKTYSVTLPVLTRDENIVRVSLNVQYRVGDPVRYLFGTRNGDDVLQQAAQSAVREVVGRSDLDTVLGARGALSVTAREQLAKAIEAYRTGLVVTELNLPDARPPDEVKPAFDDVNSAQQDKDRRISEARAYAAKVVPEARGQAARVRTVAEGYKTAVVAHAQGDAARFTQLLPAYRAAPEVTRKRLWLETVQQVLADNRKVVGGDGRQLIYVPMAGAGNGGGMAAGTPPLLPADILSQGVSATTDGGDLRPQRPASRDEDQQ